jgi:hypothetical protein
LDEKATSCGFFVPLQRKSIWQILLDEKATICGHFVPLQRQSIWQPLIPVKSHLAYEILFRSRAKSKIYYDSM